MTVFYQLKEELLPGHAADVRCSTVLSDGKTLVTGSRDSTARIWRETAAGSATSLGAAVTEVRVTDAQGKGAWVLSLLSLKNGNLFAMGCDDSVIRVCDDGGAVRVASRPSFKGKISSLASFPDDAQDEFIISGSWDGYARIWRTSDLSIVEEYPNHENIVCVAGLSGGNRRFATGSSGMAVNNQIVGFKIRIFERGNQTPLQIIADAHQGPVKCLARFDETRFASTSNDGSSRLFRLEEDGVYRASAVMTNPVAPGVNEVEDPNYNYCVARVDERCVGVCGEEGVVRIWNALDTWMVEAEIEHPCPVWWISLLGNGDLVTCGADGVARVFTRREEAFASDEVIGAYHQLVERVKEERRQKAANRANGGGAPAIDPNTLVRIENAARGEREGHVKMFNKGGEAWAYQWNAEAQTWVELGAIQGGEGAGKQALNGEFYDRVVPVEIEDPATGSTKRLKVGFNVGDNPYVIANAFIKENDLSEGYLDDIVQYLGRNGLSGITSSSSSSSSSSTTTGMTSSNHSTRQQQQQQQQQRNNFPLQDALGLVFDNISALDKALAKLGELSSQQKETRLALTPSESEELSRLVETLKNTSRYHASTLSSRAVEILVSKITGSWPLKDRFPGYDLVRAALTHPDGGNVRFAGKLGANYFVETARAATAPGVTPPTTLTAVRSLCNLFRWPESNKAAVGAMRDPAHSPLEVLFTQLEARSADPNTKLALATLLLNAANAVVHAPRSDRDASVLLQCLRGVFKLLKTCAPPHEEAFATRLFQALGCVATVEPNFVKDVWKDELLPLISSGVVDPKNPTLQQVIATWGLPPS